MRLLELYIPSSQLLIQIIAQPRAWPQQDCEMGVECILLVSFHDMMPVTVVLRRYVRAV